MRSNLKLESSFYLILIKSCGHNIRFKSVHSASSRDYIFAFYDKAYA